MSRTRIELTEDQAQALAGRMVAIDAEYPVDNRDHRPFVRAFLRALYDITGKVFSPTIVRRWMVDFAPGRNPSTSTLESEKKALEQALGQEAAAARQVDDPGGGPELYQVVRRAVADEMDRRGSAAVPAGAFESDKLAIAQRDFLQEKLTQTEIQLAEVRAQAARLAADAQAARAERDVLQAQLESGSATTERQAELLAKLSDSIESMRKFAMTAIDQVRGETRAWQDRYTSLENQQKELKQLIEYFRQMAYARGAPVPASLRGENKG